MFKLAILLFLFHPSILRIEFDYMVHVGFNLDFFPQFLVCLLYGLPIHASLMEDLLEFDESFLSLAVNSVDTLENHAGHVH